MSTNAKVKQRASLKRSSITDKALFGSRKTRENLLAVAIGFLVKVRCTKTRIKLQLGYDKKNEMVACTNGSTIYINAACDLVKYYKDQTDRYRAVRGLLAHELGHIAYTNFATSELCLSRIRAGRLSPDPVDDKSTRFRAGLIGLEGALDSKDEETLDILAGVILQASNVLEDGYIEERILEGRHGVLSDDLELVRKAHFATMPTLHELEDKEADGDAHRFQTLMILLLSYGKFGDFRYENKDELKSPAVLLVYKCLPAIDEYLETRDSMRRFALLYTCLCLLWPELSSYIEWVKEKREEQKQNDEEGAADPNNVSGGMSNAGGTPSGTTSNTAEDDSSGSGSGSPPSQNGKGSKGRQNARSSLSKAIQKAAASSAVGENESDTPGEESSASGSQSKASESAKEDAEQSEDGTEKGAAEPSEDGEDGAENGAAGQSDADDGEEEGGPEAQSGADAMETSPGSGSIDGVQDVTDAEGGRFGREQGECEDAEDDGVVETDDEYEAQGYDKAADDIDRLLDSIATDMAEAELDAEKTSALQSEAKNMNLGNRHKNVNIHMKRVTDIPESLIEQYNQVAPQINVIVTHTTRKLDQMLKDKRQGGKRKNLYVGRRFDAGAAYRDDGRVFSNQKLPGGAPQVAFGLLLDESGSMSYGDRTTYARTTALIMHGICQKLSVPLTVYGHTTGDWDGVDMHLYADFEAYDNNDKYRMMDISSRNANRDGAALRFVGEQLIKRPENTKVLFVVCDGQPADYGYSGDEAEQDLREVKAYLKKNGVDLVVAAIGDDKENIHRIYGDSFMDITNLQKLPTILPKKLLEFIDAD